MKLLLPKTRAEWAQQLAQIVTVTVVLVLLYGCVKSHLWLQKGPSMMPTFPTSSVVVVLWSSHSPQRGDIVIVRQPDGVFLIKRIVGLPGETIDVLANSRVRANGELLDEDYLPRDWPLGRSVPQSWTLGLDEYFILGDNRSNSRDSRDIGPVRKDQIVLVLLRWFCV